MGDDFSTRSGPREENLDESRSMIYNDSEYVFSIHRGGACPGTGTGRRAFSAFLFNDFETPFPLAPKVAEFLL